jgi:protein-S-isoprenylcysteine O-methyltransferase Ste14
MIKEEKFLTSRYGEEYKEYSKKSELIFEYL